MSLPVKACSSFPVSPEMLSSGGAVAGILPDIISSIGTIVDSCNNKEIRIHEITKYAELETNRIEKDSLDKYNRRKAISNIIRDAFISDKFSGDQIIELVKLFNL